jgi:hypothetical protein
MSNSQIKKMLRQYINEADENFLRAVYALMEYDRRKESFLLTTAQKKILNQRKSNHANGKSKSFTWEEVKQRAQAALNK